ncbi:MAG: hypothetical protein GWO24_27505 [Akkermansiaceae bacterium]|nr:hypothetical protein [Akkermansiaceae bacterium]
MIKVPLAVICGLSLAVQGEQLSFGDPEMRLVKEMERDGRTILRYEHDNVPEWGYAKPQQDYFYLLPLGGNPENRPLHVVLHSAGHSGDAVLADAFKHPDWFHYAGRDDQVVLYLDCRKNKGDWWWGGEEIKRGKEKYADEYCPAEKRVLTTIEWAIRTYKIDRDRVYLSGISMGGSGSLGIGMRRGDIFAAVNVAVPAGIEHLQARFFDRDVPDPPILVNFSAPNDGWSRNQEELIAYFQRKKFPLVFAWGPYGHNSSVAQYHPAARAFPWRSIRKDEAYPVFSNATTDQKYPGFRNAAGGDEAGQLGAVFRWKTVADEAELFEIDLWLVGRTELKTAVEIPTRATAAVSLRRLQSFKTEPGAPLRWNLSRDDLVLQSGKANPSSTGLLTIEDLVVGDQPARLRITP